MSACGCARCTTGDAKREFDRKSDELRSIHRRILEKRLIVSVAKGCLQSGRLPPALDKKLSRIFYLDPAETEWRSELTPGETESLRKWVDPALDKRLERILMLKHSPAAQILEKPAGGEQDLTDLSVIESKCRMMQENIEKLAERQASLADMKSETRFKLFEEIVAKLEKRSRNIAENMNLLKDEMNSMMPDSTRNTMKLLKTQLQCKLENEHSRVEWLESTTQEYRQLAKGTNFVSLAKEYGKLRAAIERKQWAIHEVRNESGLLKN